MEKEFPQFRKYPNNKSFFKVFSQDEFEEIQVLGDNYLLTRVKAKILPDRNLIADMISAENNWVKIRSAEYEEVAKRVGLNNKN